MQKNWKIAERTADDLATQLLHNRGIKGQEEIESFLNPPRPQEIIGNYQNYIKKIGPKEVDKALTLIKKTIAKGRPTVIHGDYDVDGLCGTAILYEALKKLGTVVIPFIPDRFDEGYGLSIASIDKIQQLVIESETPNQQSPLLITTDCGITAVDAVKYAKTKGFNVIITDHHQKPPQLPPADALVWTDELAGAGIAWILARRLASYKTQAIASDLYENLDMVTLATIADLQPLLGVNRSLVKHGLEKLNNTRNVGLQELIKVSGLERKEIGTYEVGWMLAPRLNAAGRLQTATAALQLLITEDANEAAKLAAKLHHINAERQQVTQQALEAARKQHQEINTQEAKLILLTHQEWHEGVIGLVAGRIKEEFHRPAIIISEGEEISKGSARSISGFNIVEAIRACEEHLLDAGGHEMAAGFTVETAKITEFHKKISSFAQDKLDEETLQPTLRVDARLKPSSINWETLKKIKDFEPHGIGNPTPTFLTENLEVVNVRTVGSDNKHLRLYLKPNLSAIGFEIGHLSKKIFPGDLVDIIYTLEENVWNGQRHLQLKLKDLHLSQKQGVDKESEN